MKYPLFRVGLAILVACVALTSFGIVVGLAAPDRTSPTIAPAARDQDELSRILIRIISPEVESTLFVKLNWRQIDVVGHIACDPGEMVRIRAEITQAQTGAVAEGHTQNFCTGDVQRWFTKAMARGPIAFAAGSAQACAWAETRLRGKETDTYQWCVDVQLVETSR